MVEEKKRNSEPVFVGVRPSESLHNPAEHSRVRVACVACIENTNFIRTLYKLSLGLT